MPSLRPLFALAALGLLSSGANATPCKPVTTTTIASAVASATTSGSEADTSTIDAESSTVTAGVTTTEDGTTTVIVAESSTTEAETTTTTAEATTTTAEATTTTAEASTTATVCQVAVETNYFQNPGFDTPEPSSDTEVAYWSQWSHAYFTHSSAGKPARSGDHLLEVDVSRPLEDLAGEVWQDVTGLAVGSWYRVSTWVAPTYVDDANWANRCYVEVNAGTQRLASLPIDWADDGEYVEKTFDFQATVSDIEVKFYIYCEHDSFHVDRFLFDDFSLLEFCPAESR